MSAPKVSVIVPVYNAAQWLRRCVDSLLAQTMTDFELLLIDDGSTDGSPAICDTYAAADPRVRAFHKPNGGVSSARNLGLDCCHGGVITFCDSDDYVNETYLEVLTSHPGADLTIGSFVYEQDNNITDGEHLEQGIYDKDRLRRQLSDYPDHILLSAPWAKLFRTELIKTIGLRFDENLHGGEDTIFVLQYLLFIKTAYCVDSAVYHYNMTGTGLSMQYHNRESVFAFVDALYNAAIGIEKVYGVTPRELMPFYFGRYPAGLVRDALLSDWLTRNKILQRIRNSRSFDLIFRLSAAKMKSRTMNLFLNLYNLRQYFLMGILAKVCLRFRRLPF